MNLELIKEIKEFGKKLSVLYVEDNIDARASTYDVLEEFFGNIDVAVDGKEGLGRFYEKKYDLVITDINMPNLNGIEMIEEIRKSDENLPILIISAYNESGYFMETIRLGVEGYLLKPIELDQFISMLAKVVEKIKLKEQNESYKLELEDKVKAQLEELREKDKILFEKSKHAAMGEMIDAIAHQLKQPLGIIKMQAQHLEYMYNKNRSDKKLISRSTEGTILQVDHLVSTINEFRDFLRPNNDLEKVNLKELISSVLVLLKDELLRCTVEVQVLIDENIFIDIIANEFKHILINIINNAKDAFVENKKKGRVIEIEAKKNKSKIEILLSDNAGGIPEKIIHRIFEPNFTTKKIDAGTGIGLYMSKTIIEKIGGSIEAYNKGSGACFKITI